jgi:hypothetical protein
MEPGLSSPASWSGRPADWRHAAVDALAGKVKAGQGQGNATPMRQKRYPVSICDWKIVSG